MTADPLTLCRFVCGMGVLYRNRYFNATEIGTKIRFQLLIWIRSAIRNAMLLQRKVLGSCEAIRIRYQQEVPK